FYDVIPDDQDTWKEKDPESLLWTLHPSIGLNVIGADGSFLTVDSLTHQELLEIETAADGTVILHEHIAVVSGDGTPFTGASAKLVAGSSIIMSRDIAVRSEVVPLKYLTEAPQFYEGADPVQPGSAVQFAVTPLGAYGMCPEEGVSDSGFYSFRAEYTGGETAAVTSCVMAAGESYSAYVFDLPQNLEDLTSLTLGQIVISMKPE
ncbi:MAG: hypothetical protein IJ239_02275, partial [Eubacterium sp.]|nr:hypothetical protein [Eubacterium sp.]